MNDVLVGILAVAILAAICEWRLERHRRKLERETFRFNRVQTKLSDAIIRLQRTILEGRNVEEIFRASAHLLVAWNEFKAFAGPCDEPRMVHDARLLVTEYMVAHQDTDTI